MLSSVALARWHHSIPCIFRHALTRAIAFSRGWALATKWSCRCFFRRLSLKKGCRGWQKHQFFRVQSGVSSLCQLKVSNVVQHFAAPKLLWFTSSSANIQWPHNVYRYLKMLCWYLISQLTLPSQRVSLSIGDEIDSIIPSELGILVIPEEASSLMINSQYADQPLFWSLDTFVMGDQVSRLLLFLSMFE